MVPALARPARRLTILALTAWAASWAPPQEEGPGGARPPGPFEGPLANDTFLPTRQDSSAKLLAGDLAWAAWVADAAGSNRSEPLDIALDGDAIDAFEAWRAALEGCEAGDSVDLVPFPPAQVPAEEPRHGEGVAGAVLRRLASLSPPEREAFRARFEEAAAIALDAAGSDLGRLTEVELENPLTAGAAKAALRLCDAAIESGRLQDAASWLARAERHVDLSFPDDPAPRDPAWPSALARRRAVLSELEPPRQPVERWSDARDLELVSTVRFPELSPGPEARDLFGRSRGLRPGAAILADGRIAVQTANAIFTVGDGGSILTFVFTEFFAQSLRWPYAAPFGDGSGDWPLAPATDGEVVVVVAGRSAFGRENALLCLSPPQTGEPPTLRWALSGLGFVGPADARLGPGEVLPDGQWEFQPGPLVTDGRVYVQARHRPATGRGPRAREEGRTRAHLLAIDVRTGRPVWVRFLALGSDLQPETIRGIGSRSGFEAAAQPLIRSDRWILASTDLGIASLVDQADGRIAWSFRYRRRASDAPGWAASNPPARAAPCLSDERGGILLAPADSDFLYWLQGEELLSSERTLELRPPEPIGRATELLGGDRCAAVVLARAEPFRTVSSWRAASGERIDSAHLGRGEATGWLGLVSERRVLLATGRELYLLDRERDLLLLDQETLSVGPGWSEGRGGSVLAAGDRVYVAESRGLSILTVAR